MNIKKSIFFICIAICITILSGMSLLLSNSVDIKDSTGGTVIFNYDGSNINEYLSQDDLNFIIKLFDNKIMYRDDPSCGFTKNTSILLDDSEYFCFARDSCPVIYWANRIKYFKLSNSEYKSLIKMLSEYGVFFPCV